MRGASVVPRASGNASARARTSPTMAASVLVVLAAIASAAAAACTDGPLLRFTEPAQGFLAVPTGTTMGVAPDGLTADECARRCLDKGPTCLAFQYQPVAFVCALKKIRQGPTTPLSTSARWHRKYRFYNRIAGAATTCPPTSTAPATPATVCQRLLGDTQSAIDASCGSWLSQIQDSTSAACPVDCESSLGSIVECMEAAGVDDVRATALAALQQQCAGAAPPATTAATAATTAAADTTASSGTAATPAATAPATATQAPVRYFFSFHATT